MYRRKTIQIYQQPVACEPNFKLIVFQFIGHKKYLEFGFIEI